MWGTQRKGSGLKLEEDTVHRFELYRLTVRRGPEVGKVTGVGRSVPRHRRRVGQPRKVRRKVRSESGYSQNPPSSALR